MTIRSTVRWAATHGVMRVATLRRARAGNPDAQLLVDPALQADPYTQYEKLRTDAPFAPGALSRLSVRHDICTAVLRSDDFGVLAQDVPVPAPLRLALRLAGPPPHPGPLDPPSMLAVNPPTHTRYRRLVTRAFTARAVAALRERTELIAHGLLDDLERAARDGDGRVDLVAGYAALLPVTVISEMLGVPAAMRERFLAWGDGAAASLDMGLTRARFAEVEVNLAAIDAWMREHLRRLRREPGGDLLSTLVALTDDDGSGLTEDELVATASLVLGAGFETTVNLIGNGAALLFAHPDQRSLLAERPELWPNAVDEVLRVESPVQRTVRRARRATTVGGVGIAEGELVVTLLAAANRDPAVFTDPHAFDVTRPNAKEHVSFSSGLHYCLGAALARMEGEVALRALFERFEGLTPAGPARRRATRVLRGYQAMPVALASRSSVPG
ncbi:cytochrome P450 [Pseudonocardia lacus]|uniref:cytochrome P450 n=1 Tax=Pseudonocardia lacus TaxID=2835865 RepID=UPI002027CF8B|nr:cytochrome P450 [Pseudonocardia lacus]